MTIQHSTQDIIDQTKAFARTTLTHAEGSHDWFHTHRVWQVAKQIARTESVDILIVELGALLHDIADAKFHDGDEEIGPKTAADFLSSLQVGAHIIDHVRNIVANISFKGGNEEQPFHSKELDVVQDADRLDALGAIGIARTFAYGGYKEREIYNPAISPHLQMSKEEYRRSTAPSINHFYEKLLLLHERMNTETGRAMALHRHQFMETFLEEFYHEWDGQR